jgi:uncharacterized protein YndB with AHSA1/START domain
MSTPNVPLRLAFDIQVPGTPEQVWAAIATAAGQSAWFLPTDSDERSGGRQVVHMGAEDAPADITAWEPPRRLVYEEDLTALLGKPDAAITPLTTELLVEARSGGSCVVRVVSSAFGSGADWEHEFFDAMESTWMPFFDQLRVYLAHFPGQRVTSFTLDRSVPGARGEIQDAARRILGVDAVGDRFTVGATAGVVERLDPVLLVRLEVPVPGMVRVWSDGSSGDGSTEVIAYLFPTGDDGSLVEEVRGAWSVFVDDLMRHSTEVHQ